jgi:hypothetical protein
VRHRLFSLFVLVLTLSLLLPWAAAAEGPEPGSRSPGAAWMAQDIGAAAAGSPGLAFRYAKTFGVTEVAYPPGTSHLNRPNGLFMDASDNLYVVEEFGQRLLEYRTSDGHNLLTVGTAGLYETGENTFADPRDVAPDADGNIWVVDDHRAVQFDSGGNFLQQLPAGDPYNSGDDTTHFDEPHGVAFDSAGRMYISDTGNDRVQVYDFDVSGSPVFSATIGGFNHPAQVALDSSDRLYVADVENYRIQRCVYAAGWTCSTFHGTGSAGSGANQLNLAYGLAVDGSDNVYIGDGGNGRVKKCDSLGVCSVLVDTGLDWAADVAFDSSGNLYVSDWVDNTIRKYDSSGNPLGVFVGVSDAPYITDGSHINNPHGVSVDNNGDVYVITDRGDRLVKFDAGGNPQWTIGTPGVWGNANDQFGDYWRGPTDVATGPGGKVYVADTGNQRVQIFDSSGSYVATLGSRGSGAGQFIDPYGVAVDSNGNIYVADEENQRVQIFNSSLSYVAQLGQTGVAGDDDDHFSYPQGVTVDKNGNIYVADSSNNRVQVFNSSRTYVRTIGHTGEGDSPGFGWFSQPQDVAVDAQGRVYVADAWWNRVEVFDSDGDYLTTLGGTWGKGTGMFRNPMSVAVDASGNVYVADAGNHRVQKYSPGVPGWAQVNVNGFGRAYNWAVLALEPFNGQLYAGTGTAETGLPAELWRAGDTWTQVGSAGLGNSNNVGIDDLIEFGGKLYAGIWNDTDGGEVRRSDDGAAWSPVAAGGFGDAHNTEAFRLATFGGALYAATWNDSQGGEIWRSSSGNPGTWSQVVDGGFGDPNNIVAISMAEFDGALYAATYNPITGGAEVWRSDTGNAGSWSQVNSGGFGDSHNEAITLESFGGSLYAGTINLNTGAEIWSCSACDGSDWIQVMSGGFGNAYNWSVESLIPFDGELYAFTSNAATGMEVWRSADGTGWQVMTEGIFANSSTLYWDNATAVFDAGLYVAAYQYSSYAGGKIWLMLDKQVYLPLVLK